jgi:hypothetical protein
MSPETTKSPQERFVSSGRTFIDNNTGFLLIGVGQACFAAMDVAVKKANQIDPSIPILEVSTLLKVQDVSANLRVMIKSSSSYVWCDKKAYERQRLN